MSVLEVCDVRRSFGGIQAVCGVDLSVARQEIVGIIGPNGSGKSTLFNLISGVHPLDGGRIVLLGRDVTGWPAYRVARAGLGRTFQIPALFQNMTVRQNLLAAAVEGNWRGAPQRAEEVLKRMDLAHLAEALADALSGGQQRLLEFGRLLMRDSEVILLDEVTAGVHPRLRRTILRAVAGLRAEGKTFLVIEHDMELVREVCDRIVVMHFGEVVAHGSFDEVANDPQVMEVYLGHSVR